MATPAAPNTPRQATWIALLVAVTFFMENLDATVIATALPQMARDFAENPVSLNIGISAYLLAVAVFIPLSGWVADRFGARQVFAGAIGLFTLASWLCGLAPTLETFVAARVLQGIGGALMVPVGRLVVLRTTEKQDLVKMLAVITWPGLVAPVLGPPLGGLIVTHLSWPWIFYLNIPLGGLAIAAAWWLIPNARASETRRFDLMGFVFLASACAAWLLGLEMLGSLSGGSLGAGAALVAAGALLTWLSVRHCRRHPQPLLPLATLGIATFRASIVGGTLFRLSISALPFLIPLLLQVGFGLSPVDAGLLVLAIFAGNLAMKPFTTGLLRRHGFRRVLLVNGLIGVGCILACLGLQQGMAWYWMALVLFVGGLSRSMQFTTYNAVGFAEVPKAQMGEASTLFSMFFQLAMALGVAVAALLLRVAMQVRGGEGGLAVSDFHWALFGVALVACAALVDAVRLPRNAGEQVLRT
ncbi:MFS transporter [Pantoea sp. Tr-811]|uniref:MFS transporter n=1 Tax=unclassified Pantoea TaxID=2630326 RepID=UPI0014221FD4|nr:MULTISPECIES: MFS transporter [unclassified Pantoea]NIE78393.1 MFS transporter [Pantoea sp. Ap-967]NIF29066.1 MFS transporter [Pantoea sp. Tr-811]